MKVNIHHGYLLMADISGFDNYLVNVELEHAQGILQELLELIIGSLSPPLHLASLEGDSVFAYAPGEEITRGETLLEITEATYTAFRDRLESIHRNNTCHCQACSRVPDLDLKFLVHYGEFTAQTDRAGTVELGGLHANLVRERLLKDQKNGTNGSRAYALFTEQSLDQLGLQPDGMQISSGLYPHLGEIKTACLDLRPSYLKLTESRQAYIPAEEADLVLTHEYTAPPQVLWEWLNDPDKRTRWMILRKWKAGLRPGGRTGIGAHNHCAHGLGSIIETVLDWRPHHYFSVKLRQDSLRYSAIQTYELEPLEGIGGTRLVMRTRFPMRWLSRQLLRPMLAFIWQRDLVRLGRLLASEGE